MSRNENHLVISAVINHVPSMAQGGGQRNWEMVMIFNPCADQSANLNGMKIIGQRQCFGVENDCGTPCMGRAPACEGCEDVVMYQWTGATYIPPGGFAMIARRDTTWLPMCPQEDWWAEPGNCFDGTECFPDIWYHTGGEVPGLWCTDEMECVEGPFGHVCMNNYCNEELNPDVPGQGWPGPCQRCNEGWPRMLAQRGTNTGEYDPFAGLEGSSDCIGLFNDSGGTRTEDCHQLETDCLQACYDDGKCYVNNFNNSRYCGDCQNSFGSDEGGNCDFLFGQPDWLEAGCPDCSAAGFCSEPIDGFEDHNHLDCCCCRAQCDLELLQCQSSNFYNGSYHGGLPSGDPCNPTSFRDDYCHPKNIHDEQCCIDGPYKFNTDAGNFGMCSYNDNVPNWVYGYHMVQDDGKTLMFPQYAMKCLGCGTSQLTPENSGCTQEMIDGGYCNTFQIWCDEQMEESGYNSCLCAPNWDSRFCIDNSEEDGYIGNKWIGGEQIEIYSGNIYSYGHCLDGPSLEGYDISYFIIGDNESDSWVPGEQNMWEWDHTPPNSLYGVPPNSCGEYLRLTKADGTIVSQLDWSYHNEGAVNGASSFSDSPCVTGNWGHGWGNPRLKQPADNDWLNYDVSDFCNWETYYVETNLQISANLQILGTLDYQLCESCATGQCGGIIEDCDDPDACNYGEPGNCDYGTMCWDGSYECDASDCPEQEECEPNTYCSNPQGGSNCRCSCPSPGEQDYSSSLWCDCDGIFCLGDTGCDAPTFGECNGSEYQGMCVPAYWFCEWNEDNARIFAEKQLGTTWDDYLIDAREWEWKNRPIGPEAPPDILD